MQLTQLLLLVLLLLPLLPLRLAAARVCRSYFLWALLLLRGSRIDPTAKSVLLSYSAMPEDKFLMENVH